MKTAQEITEALGGTWNGKQGQARCPAHDDTDPSLSISEAPDGKPLWYCHAGCPQEKVGCALAERGLWKASANTDDKPDWASAQYVYRDSDGAPLYRVLRKDPKGFVQQRYEDGRWMNGVKGIKKVPYMLHRWDDDAHDVIYLVEGEKDADRLWKHGARATTNSGGAGKFTKELAEYFRGYDVKILPDNDGAGQKHAQEVAQQLTGIADNVSICVLPCLPEKGDISDWLDTNDFSAFVDTVKENEVAWSEANGGTHSDHNDHTSSCGMTLSQLMAMDFPGTVWAVQNMIPAGLTLLAGKPKVGKSWLAYQLCISVATGHPFLSTHTVTKGKAAYLALEDTAKRLRRRAEEISEDLEIDLADEGEDLTLFTDWERLPDGGLARLERYLDHNPETVIVVIDVLARVRGEDSDSYRDDYGALKPLQELAQDRGVAIVIIHHLRKMEASDPQDMISGTNGLMGATDTNFVLRKRSDGEVMLSMTGREIVEAELLLKRQGVIWVNQGEPVVRPKSPEACTIRDYLASEGPCRPKDISATLGLDPDNTRKLLRSMEKRDELVRVRTGVYAVPELVPRR